jgi:hypothetical protein
MPLPSGYDYDDAREQVRSVAHDDRSALYGAYGMSPLLPVTLLGIVDATWLVNRDRLRRST